MRAHSLSDTIFFNQRDGFSTAAVLLDGPPDLATVIAQIEGVCETSPGWRERPVRIVAWSFAAAPQEIDPAEHIFVVHDPSLNSREAFVAQADRLRRSRLGSNRPPWRIFVVNPAGGLAGPDALSGLLVQFRHGVADATRGLQALKAMGGVTVPGPQHEEAVGRLRQVDIARLTTDIAVHDEGMVAFDIARGDVPRSGDPALALARAVDVTIRNETLFPSVAPLTGNVGRTRMERRRASGTGNHVRLESIATETKTETPKRLRIPGLERAQKWPINQFLVAIAPGPLARLMMRIWYTGFDGVATLLPVPSRLSVGGSAVHAVYSVPPLWGPIPLAVTATAGRTHFHLTAFPGRGFGGDHAALVRALSEAMTANVSPDKPPDRAVRSG